MARAVIIFLLIAVSSCTSRLESRTINLVNAKNLWIQTNPNQSYSFAIVRHCNCTLSGVSVRVTVVSDTVVSTLHSQDHKFTGEPNRYGYLTIPGYFNLIPDLIEKELHSDLELEVKYDAQFGYPLLVAWSEPGVMDSAARFEISRYVPK